MTELLRFVRESPWWTLFYLIVISGAFRGLIGLTIKNVRRGE